MAKNESEGQLDRTKNGKDFERLVHKKLEAFLVRAGLDDNFILLGQTIISLSNGASLKPDHVIRIKSTGTDIVYFGDKKSFRERWKLDDRDARMAKDEYPNRLWVEITMQERDEDSTEQIQRNCERIKKQSKFDMVVSTSLPDTFKELYQMLEKYLSISMESSI